MQLCPMQRFGHRISSVQLQRPWKTTASWKGILNHTAILPYEVLDQVDGVDSEKECLHLFHCPHCDYSQKYHYTLIGGRSLLNNARQFDHPTPC